MPTIEISYNDLCALIGKEIPVKKLEESLFLNKCEIEASTLLEDESDYELTVEVTSDRPDLLSVEGIARQMKGFLELEPGLPAYNVADSGITVLVDRNLTDIRPYIACGVVKGLIFTDELIRQLIQLQEKLHTTYCRSRRKASIGIHNLDAIQPPIRYYGEKPEEINFIPLGETSYMNGYEILSELKTGCEYGYIIEKFPLLPLIVDAKNDVLSLPPIINGIVTRVTEDTKNLFFDITATDEKTASFALNILLTNLNERDAKIESVKVIYPDKETIYPNLTPLKMNLNIQRSNNLLGLDLDTQSTIKLLKKMRMDAKILGDNDLEVTIPAYRADFLHEWDIIEDVSIAFGYDVLEPILPQSATVGKEVQDSKIIRKLRDLIAGFGFQEVLNYVTTNRKTMFDKMLLAEEITVELANPTSLEYNVLRKYLLPGLLNFLSKNTHADYPQKIFEVGDVVIYDEMAPEKARNVTKLATVICDYIVSYEEIEAVLFSLLKNFRAKFEIRAEKHASYIEGRVAEVFVEGESIGFLGELHPEVILNFGLENHVSAFEIDLSKTLL